MTSARCARIRDPPRVDLATYGATVLVTARVEAEPGALAGPLQVAIASPPLASKRLHRLADLASHFRIEERELDAD